MEYNTELETQFHELVKVPEAERTENQRVSFLITLSALAILQALDDHCRILIELRDHS
jgi:hypothetical protein